METGITMIVKEFLLQTQKKLIRKGENIARIRAEQARINKKEKMKRNINVAKNLTTKRQIKQARGINH